MLPGSKRIPSGVLDLGSRFVRCAGGRWVGHGSGRAGASARYGKVAVAMVVVCCM